MTVGTVRGGAVYMRSMCVLLDKKQASWQANNKQVTRQTSERANERTNQQKKRKKNSYHIAPCVWCALYFVCCCFFFVSFLLLFLDFDSSYFLLYASSRVFCHAIYLICSLMFLHRIQHFWALFFAQMPSRLQNERNTRKHGGTLQNSTMPVHGDGARDYSGLIGSAKFVRRVLC